MDVDQEEKNQYSLVCIQSVQRGFHSEQGQKGERCKEKNCVYFLKL